MNSIYLFAYPNGRQVREEAPNKTAAIKQHMEKTGTPRKFIIENVKIINLGRAAN